MSAGKSLKDFTALDAAIVDAIKVGKDEFSKITPLVRSLAGQHATRHGSLFKCVESRLQALRRAGLLVYTDKRWRVA